VFGRRSQDSTERWTKKVPPPKTPPRGSIEEPSLASISKTLEAIRATLRASRPPQSGGSNGPRKEATLYIAFTTLVFTVFAVIAGGSLYLTYDSLSSAQERAYSDITTQAASRVQYAVDTLVPLAVNRAVDTAVPQILRIAAETGVARELPTVWLTLVPPAAAIFATPPTTPVPVTPGVPTEQPQPSQYAIIVASDTSPSYLIRYAADLKKKDYLANVYKVGDVYALVVGTFDSTEALQEGLVVAKSSITDSAYFIDMSLSCLEWDFVDPGYFTCVLPPL